MMSTADRHHDTNFKSGV